LAKQGTEWEYFGKSAGGNWGSYRNSIRAGDEEGAGDNVTKDAGIAENADYCG
jgi:hypothetical protein